MIPDQAPHSAVKASLPTRPRWPRKRLWTLLLGLMVGGLLLTLAGRSVLIHQMRLPRLALDQGGNVMAVSITPDGRTILSGDDPTDEPLRLTHNSPADVLVWDAASGRIVRRLHGFYWRSSGVAASPDSRHVIATGITVRYSGNADSNRVYAWDMHTGQRTWAATGDLPLSDSPDGRYVGIGNGVYNAATGRLICRTLPNFEWDGQSGFSPDGKLFGIIGDVSHKNMDLRSQSFYAPTRLHLWRTDTGKEAQDFPFTRVRAFDFARNGQWLVMTSDRDGHIIGGTDGSVVRRVDIKTGTVAWTRERNGYDPKHDSDAILNSVAVSPNGKYVVLQSDTSRLIILDARTGHELFRPLVSQGRNDPSWALPGGLAFSADGRTLVSRCGRQVLVWDASLLQ